MSSTVPLMSAVQGAKEGAILSNDSGLVHYRSRPCTVTLDQQAFAVHAQDKHEQLLIGYPASSLIGMKYKIVTVKGKTCYRAELFFYPTVSGCCGGPRAENRRQRRVVQLIFNTNESVLIQWMQTIQSYVAGKQADLAAADPSTTYEVRKFVVFVNPKSGSGTALKIWRQTVCPMFQEAGIEVTLIVTEYANHAKEYVSNMNHLTAAVEAVVIIGGDGLLFEVVNGIADREDSAQVWQRLVLAPIPGGTGNGLIKSILFSAHEEGTPMNAAFCTIRGAALPIDMATVTTKSGTVHHSFLSLAWGLVADIDILSESMRFLGEPRMYVAAVYFVMARRFYEGRLCMKLVHSTYQTSSPVKGTPSLKTNKINKLLPADVDGGDGWVTLEGRFMMVFAVQTSHCSMSMFSGPGIALDDGLFTVYVVQDIGRLGLLSLLLSFDSGDFINSDHVRIFKCNEYSLQPLTKKGRYSLDGELIEYDLIEASVLPKAMKVKGMP